ncbi:MAG: hypothetical protein RMK98_02655 [Bacteroidia bacterium]|nr:hypothetical protein [Bacteroidia bacterium]
MAVPHYDFEQPHPFHGTSWYNPFIGDTLIWYLANFHIHSRAWKGLTNGYQEAPVIRRVYDSLGYTWIGISDYQSINPLSPIPLYEHGWNVGKVHQLCFGSEKVIWMDVPFWQGIQDKQWILSKLRPYTKLLVIAHPRFLGSYRGEELAKLGGYDAIEVLNRYGDSVAEWDSALSSGHFAPILAHDNLHDAYNPHEIMSRWTELLCPPNASLDSLQQAILAGKTVGYKNRTAFPVTQLYPKLAQVILKGDTLRVRLTLPADTLRLRGQQGSLRKEVYQSATIEYTVQPEDTYLRIEAITPQVEMYATPLVRGEPRRRNIPPSTFPHGTTLLYLVVVLVIGIIGWRWLGLPFPAKASIR